MQTLNRKQSTSTEAYEALASLAYKINAELERGQPLHAKGHEDCLWGVDGYPAEYFAALELLAADLPWASKAFEEIQ